MRDIEKPTVGRIVHYVSYGTPGGEFTSECRAAIVTEDRRAGLSLSLAIFNPSGMFFNEVGYADSVDHLGGTWHWPERSPAVAVPLP